MKKVIEKIESLREEKKISTAELERKAGLANGTLRKWKTSDPKLSSMEAVAAALGMTVSELLQEDGKENLK